MSFSDKLVNAFKGRLNRRNYLIGSVLLLLWGLFEVYFLPRTFDALYIALVSSVVLTFRMSIIVRRAHDVGWSRTIINLLILLTLFDFGVMLSVKALIAVGAALGQSFLLLKGILVLLRFATTLPLLVVSVLLLFRKGQDGPNEYGDPPALNIRFPQDLLSGSGIFNFKKPEEKT